jgi:flagellar biosynthetic protein FlhB
VALADGPLQIFRHHQKMMMTPQEAKQEYKEAEGDPHVKAKIRERQRAMSRGRMLQAVATADVVVTNPTHFAVALKYEDGAMSAPRVVAKGADLLAARIRELAEEAGVPLLESPPLARALYKHVEVDGEIPTALYSAVAQVLAWVYQLNQYVAGRGKRPNEPGIVVPEGLDPLETER